MGRRVRCPCGATFEIDSDQAETVCPDCGRRGRPRADGVPRRDVFISYSSHDQKIADAACAVLEQNKLRCWIAPRDILPGADWGGAIVQGIEECRLFVLVYSTNSNQSPQVLREVERAVANALPIIPFRLDQAQPTKSLEYFISSQHWMDALSPPIEQHLQQLAATVKRLLKGKSDSTPVPLIDAAAVTTRRTSRRWLPWAAAAIVAMVAAFVGKEWLPQQAEDAKAASDDAPVPPVAQEQAEVSEGDHDPIYRGLMSERFERWDRDNDGGLSASEMRRMPGIHAQEGDAFVRLFNLVDTDANQSVSKGELVGMAGAVQKAMDTDGDGRLSRSEFGAQPRFRGRDKFKAAMSAFSDKDIDKDGYLSVRESERAQAEAMLSKD
jgi:Ca2+-binding EF-hand superfamily protein